MLEVSKLRTESRQLRYLDAGEGILRHLDDMLHDKTGYPEAPTWGYAFTCLAALAAEDDRHHPLSAKALNFLGEQSVEDDEFPWEFIVYALRMAKITYGAKLPAHLSVYRQKGTRMYNWLLLRTLNKRLFGRFSLACKARLWLSLKIHQSDSGLILDELKTRSLHYHAFCLFIFAELIESGIKAGWLVRAFKNGVRFSLDHCLSDGTALFIGRGQEQIFGYGALLYALEYCDRKIYAIDKKVINLIAERLLGFQRADGSFPLVLRSGQPEEMGMGYSRHRPAGWYSYNSVWDYQPFLAYCLIKAGSIK